MATKTTTLDCPHCSNHTQHKLRLVHSFEPTWYGEDGKPCEGPGSSVTHLIYECLSCNDISLYMSVDETDEEPQLCYPDSGILDSSVPLAVRKNYIEAKSVQKKSPNAFALLVRRALEAICDDKGVASNKPLKQRLDSMAAQGIIPPTLAEVTGILRILGNAGAHNSPKDVTIPQTWRIEKLFRAIVEYVYIAPKMVADAKKSIAKPPEI